jgi:hypothetical protein
MRLSSFRFTIWQLTALIAGCAVVFAVIRTPYWGLLPATAVVLPGFAYDRAKGGSGILGAMLGGAFTYLCFFLSLDAYNYLNGESSSFDRQSPGTMITSIGLLGLSWGVVVGLFAWLVLFVRGRLFRSRYGKVETSGPVLRLDRNDCGLDRPVTGGHRP